MYLKYVGYLITFQYFVIKILPISESRNRYNFYTVENQRKASRAESSRAGEKHQ